MKPKQRIRKLRRYAFARMYMLWVLYAKENKDLQNQLGEAARKHVPYSSSTAACDIYYSLWNAVRDITEADRRADKWGETEGWPPPLTNHRSRLKPLENTLKKMYEPN